MLERSQVLLNFEARFFLNHIRIAKKIPMKKAKMHAATIPTRFDENDDGDDGDEVLVSCSKGVPEDIGRDEVRVEVEVEEASELGIWDGKVLVSVMAIDVFEGVLLSVWMGIEYEVIDSEAWGRISTTVIVVVEGIPYP